MSNWKELSGKNNWLGLLKPLNKSLCDKLIHYSKRIEAVYDTVGQSIANPLSYGQPTYEEKDFFSKVGLEHYTMNNYVYGESKFDFSDKALPSRWFGFVAVATDEGKKHLGRREILICWRGTVTIMDWINDLHFNQISASPILGKHTGNACIHAGFFSIYKSARDQVLTAVEKLVKQYQHEEISITVTGHSLGSALAILTTFDIVAKRDNSNSGSSSMTDAMVTVFAFSSPKVGNSDFVNVFNKFKNLHLLHIRHILDIVPRLPPTPNYSTIRTVLDITYTTYTINEFLRPTINSISEMVTRFHILKNLHEAIEKQPEEISRLLLLMLVQQFTFFPTQPILKKFLPQQITVLPIGNTLLLAIMLAILSFLMLKLMNYYNLYV
ncbi:phospholipase A1-IIgamma-like [Mangifera indica]|uniref:phospholipase A1-IIgamma-like n=1 Tax=Mangifera indica TaxID=29780 RepID=UPI001CFAAEA2|nr:phospholipase A1-IIgamma-like [Mangifera indica]